MSFEAEPSKDQEAVIARLEAELASLKESIAPKESTRARSTLSKDRAHRTRTLVTGYYTSTRQGSLYDAILRALAEGSKLEAQAALFKRFSKNPSENSARKLLGSIAMYQSEIARLLRHNPEFQAHCDRRTFKLQKLAAAGDARATKILSDPSFSTGGRWVGNIDEALSILCGARRLSQFERGRNVRIMRKAGLMFDIIRQDDPILFLYPRRFHREFRQAAELAKAHS